MSATHVLVALHHALLIGFVSVTLLLFAVTLINRLRVQRVRLVWRTGRIFGLPMWPTVFCGLVVLACSVNVLAGPLLPWSVLLGYLSGSLFWLIAVTFSSTILVTENGVISSVNRVGWGQIVDYFASTGKGCERYVFLYLDDQQARRRLEVAVPASRRKAFQQIVCSKLDERFEYTMKQAYGKKALEE